MRRGLIVAVAILCLSVSAGGAFAACKLGKLVELPVTMMGLRPMITAQINGADVQFIADSGAFYSMITPASAAEFKLNTTAAPWGLRVTGLGGSADVSVATVKVFTLAGIPMHNIEFLVGGSEVGGGGAGVIGQNVFRIGDVEYDLAKGAIRLMRPDGCGNTMLAYWAGAESQPYSVMDIGATSAASPHTTGTAFINGVRIRVMFDTGAATSVATLSAAKRAGIKPDAAGIVDGGYSYGVGRDLFKTWIVPVSSFKIGDEEIRNTRLRIGAFELKDADMLIGPDFFLSHRIYVASSQHKLYFTYNGGPVFNLASSPKTKTAADSGPEPASQPQDAADEPNDAAGFSRRGAAFAARHDYEHALADLTRACELKPDEPKYFYQRGIVRLENKQPAPAMQDFDRTLELKPDDVPALAARAELRLRGRDITGASADLAAVDRLSAKEADIRLFLASEYERADLLDSAVFQYDLWIAAHADDARLAGALNSRCWLRAVSGQDLADGLADCNAAFRLTPKSNPLSARILDARGLVRLRMGDFDKSIADYDAALKLQPQNAWSLYGRGVDELRRGKSSEAQADMAAAAVLRSTIAEEFKKRGITP